MQHSIPLHYWNIFSNFYERKPAENIIFTKKSNNNTNAVNENYLVDWSLIPISKFIWGIIRLVKVYMGESPYAHFS